MDTEEIGRRQPQVVQLLAGDFRGAHPGLIGAWKKSKDIIRRIVSGQYLYRVIPILDVSGKVIHRVVKPLMFEVRARDVFQVVVGASILAIPAVFTEETWSLGEQLPLANVVAITALSMLFLALFV